MPLTIVDRRRAALSAAATVLIGVTGAASAEARVTLSSGHVDAVSARIVGGRLHSLVKDGTRGGVVWRDPSSVVIRVTPRAAFTVPASLPFVGRKGSRAWLIPQVQRSGVIWAGWNTEEISRSQVSGGIRWTLRGVSGPGKLAIFQTGSFGAADVLFDSGRRLPQATTIAAGVHAHGNWTFTRPGTYRMTYDLSARTTRGATLSDAATLTFQVG